MPRRCVRLSAGIGLAILLACCLELFWFNRATPFSAPPGKTLTAGDLLAHSHGFLLQDDLLTAVEDQASIQLTVPSGYIRQIILDYQSQTLADYYVRLGETQLADHAPAGLNQTATVIDAAATELTLLIPDAGFRLRAVTLDSSFSFNSRRFALILTALLLPGLFWDRRRTLATEKMFLITGSILGALMISLSPVQFVGWDEQIHFRSMLVHSCAVPAWLTPAAQKICEMDVPPADCRLDQTLAAAWLRRLDVPSLAVPAVGQTQAFRISDVPSLPGIIAFALARLTGASILTGILAARILALASYLLLTALAIRLLPFGKHLLAAYALLPTLLFQATRLTYDTLTIAAAFVFLAALLREWQNPGQPLTLRRLALLTGSAILLTSVKSVYVPLVAAAWWQPAGKFVNRRRRLLFLLFWTFLILLILSFAILPGLIHPEPGGDSRVSGTSVAGQLAFILNNRGLAIRIIGSGLSQTLGTNLLGAPALLSYAYAGTITQANPALLVVLLLTFLSLLDAPIRRQPDGSETSCALNIEQSLFLALLALLSLVLVWLALYLSFNPVGALTVDGVQPRYYFPVALPLLLLLRRSAWRQSLSEAAWQRLALLPISLINLYGLYQHFFLPFFR